MATSLSVRGVFRDILKNMLRSRGRASWVALSWSLLPWLACTPGPPPATPAPAASSAPTASLPSTFAVSFAYEPALILRLQQDGKPYDGDAELLAPAQNAMTAEREPLHFAAGQAALTEDQIKRFAGRLEVQIEVGERTVPVLFSGGDSPFTCAQSVQAMRGLDACYDLTPTEDLVPEHCDLTGQRAWLKAREQRLDEAARCWTALDDATVERLRKVVGRPIAPQACQQLLEKVGGKPLLDQAIQLLPTCEQFLPEPIRTQAVRELARRELPEAFVAAQGGSSEQMRQFYHRYEVVAPDKAEEIRALAQKKFGPTNLTAWLSLRTALEAQRFDAWKATLCDLQEKSAQVAMSYGQPPRYASSVRRDGMMAYPSAPLRLVYMEPRPSYITYGPRVTAFVKARTGVQNVQVTGSCTLGLHWYLGVSSPARR